MLGLARSTFVKRGKVSGAERGSDQISFKSISIAIKIRGKGDFISLFRTSRQSNGGVLSEKFRSGPSEFRAS
jgi:hypothetical protein